MHKLRICMTCIEFPPDTGGVGESVKRISQMLTAAGHTVHVVVFHPKHRHAARPEQLGRKGFDTSIQDGVIVHRYQPVSRSEDCTIQDYLSDVYAELERLHQSDCFDVFHTFFLNEVGYLTTLFAKEVGRPVIASVRGADLHRNVFNAKQHSQIAWVLENANRITFVSQALERRAHALVPSVKGRTHAFWNSIVPVNFDALPVPAVPKRLGAGPVIGAFGNFRDKKGTDHLIWACAELADELDLSLLLVGDFITREKPHWERLIEASGLGERIVVTGVMPRRKALAYHHLVDIFALPSIRDGCPNALMEAMLAGQAIVATGADAIGEILTHEEDALLVPTGESAGLAAAIRRLASDQALSRRLGESAAAKAVVALAPEREQADWMGVYEAAVAPVLAQGLARRA
jgi:L-malate glycosyltransferase